MPIQPQARRRDAWPLAACNLGMNEQDHPDGPPLLCDRCGVELTPGKGDFYVVRIEAVADPTPPRFTEEDLAHVIGRKSSG
jgi:hypothetical protein